jgi:microtubule-associated protein-like 6
LTETHWSPDGKVFAVASMDHKIYLYRSDSYKLQGVCDKHNATVRHFDFSANSLYLQSDSQEDFEHLFFDVADGQHYTAGSQLRDVLWQTWTCIFGWPVQGIWPAYHPDDEKSIVEDGNSKDPSSVHRMPMVRGGLSGGDHVVYGDRSGRVGITRYPCLSKSSARFTEEGHVGAVSKIRYMCDGRYVTS